MRNWLPVCVFVLWAVIGSSDPSMAALRNAAVFRLVWLCGASLAVAAVWCVLMGVLRCVGRVCLGCT